MVRLKANPTTDSFTGLIRFQFLNGSIKRRIEAKEEQQKRLISIPQWFD